MRQLIVLAMACRQAASHLLILGTVALATAAVTADDSKQSPAPPACTWEKLAGPPTDVAGRESPPGTDGAWTYLPQWKGFLLHGGTSPTYSNETWFFDPDKKEWTLLRAHDSLAFDEAKKEWRVLLPRDIVWSTDRPGPARAQGIVYDSHRQQVILFGGHPTVDHAKHTGDPRLTRESWLGPAKLGTWALGPATGTFRHLTDAGPAGITRGVYDSSNQLVVAMPMRKGPHPQDPEPPAITWVYSPGNAKWEARTSGSAPRPFPYSGFTYDPTVKKCIYFNGYGEMWTYDAGKDVWTNMNPATSAPPRRHAAVCFDEARGVTIVHGGVHHPRSGPEAFSIHKSHNGLHLADTWCYHAARNEWTELRPANSPVAASTARDLAAYDSDRKSVVMYDLATGVWALRFHGADAPAVKATLPPAVVQAAGLKPRSKPPLDAAIKAWQEKLRNVPENTWVNMDIPMPAQGCKNMSFDPVNHCLVMLGGCGGPMFSTGDDSGYNNQVWLLDMEVGKYALRRAHHVWGPLDADYRSIRMGPGCTRGSCFDSVHNVLWTSGGNGWSGVGTTHLQSYDVAADRFSRCAPPAPWNDGECGMFVHDPQSDLLVYTDGRRNKKTYLYDPSKRTWTDGGPVPLTIDETLSMFSSRVYDPDLGVVAIFPTGKDWKLGDPAPAKLKLEELAMRTLAYDTKTKKWRDLAPKNQEQVPFCGMPGVAYDAKTRSLFLLKSDHGDIRPLDPTVPYGTLWVLDLASNTWKPAATGPASKLYMASMAFDPKLNLLVCRFGQGLWVFRHKGGCPTNAFAEK